MAHYKTMVDEAMLLWERHYERYQTLIPEYEELLKRKRELKVYPLNKIRQSDLDRWPDIPLLRFETEEAAENYLLDLTERELSRVITEIAIFDDSYVYNTLQARVLDYRYEVRTHGRPKSKYALDPDARFRKRPFSGPRRVSYSND